MKQMMRSFYTLLITFLQFESLFKECARLLAISIGLFGVSHIAYIVFTITQFPAGVIIAIVIRDIFIILGLFPLIMMAFALMYKH